MLTLGPRYHQRLGKHLLIQTMDMSELRDCTDTGRARTQWAQTLDEGAENAMFNLKKIEQAIADTWMIATNGTSW